MKLNQKIKSYFIKYQFNSWKNFHWDDYDLKFRLLDEEILVDIGSYIRNNLSASETIGNQRHRLKEHLGIKCSSLDDLMPLIRDIIIVDYSETSIESIQHNWDFQYFVSKHSLCVDTICISNGLMSRQDSGRCIYPLASVRKHDDSYFCWDHLR